MTAMLRRVTIERLNRGGWRVVRERDDTGESFTVDDLHDALDTVLAAYRPDGTPRRGPATQRQSEEQETK